MTTAADSFWKKHLLYCNTQCAQPSTTHINSSSSCMHCTCSKFSIMKLYDHPGWCSWCAPAETVAAKTAHYAWGLSSDCISEELLPHLGLIRHFLRRLALVYFVTASSSEGKTPHCAKFRQHKCSVVCVCVVWGDKQYKQMWLFQLIYRFQRQFLQSYFP